MFGFFEESKGMKIVLVTIIIISLLSYFSGIDPKELLDQLQSQRKKNSR